MSPLFSATAQSACILGQGACGLFHGTTFLKKKLSHLTKDKGEATSLEDLRLNTGLNAVTIPLLEEIRNYYKTYAFVRKPKYFASTNIQLASLVNKALTSQHITMPKQFSWVVLATSSSIQIYDFVKERMLG